MDGSFVSHADEVMNALHEKVEVALEAIGIQIDGEAAKELNNAPIRIDTGLLKNSITHAVSNKPPAISSYKGDKPSRNDKNGEIPTGSYSGTAPADPEDEKAVYIGTNVQYAVYV